MIDAPGTAHGKERHSSHEEAFLGLGLKQRVEQRSFRRVDQLHVGLHDGRVIVSGRVPSYYLLQIVQSVACEVFSPEHLDFQVVVGMPAEKGDR
jgi:hypothetical protein